jgi:glycosyltransferase involved in cell wall biosynthesis
VLYPWIDTENYVFSEDKEDFYLYVWRCIPYKKFDLIVEAFNENWKKVILVTNTKNKLLKNLQKKSKENIVWKTWIWEEEKKELFSKAKAFLFPPEEDFWIVPLEAMISWTPVIAFAKWGALETVVEGKTWVFFGEQNVESLNRAIKKFESLKFESKELRQDAEKFNKERFRKELLEFIEKKLKSE